MGLGFCMSRRSGSWLSLLSKCALLDRLCWMIFCESTLGWSCGGRGGIWISRCCVGGCG